MDLYPKRLFKVEKIIRVAGKSVIRKSTALCSILLEILIMLYRGEGTRHRHVFKMCLLNNKFF
jgi:hypothetical protein